MSLRDEIKMYTQDDGLISPDKYPSKDSTGNGLLYLSLYHILLVRLGLSNYDDLISFDSIVESCFVKKGLLKRSPTKTQEQEGKDDYVGICFASRLINSNVAISIYRYGNDNCWIYNNVNPGKFTLRSWIGRSPEIIAHIEICAGKSPGLFKKLWLLACLKFSSLNDASNAVLLWLMGCSRIKNLKPYLEQCLGSAHPIAQYWV